MFLSFKATANKLISKYKESRIPNDLKRTRRDWAVLVEWLAKKFYAHGISPHLISLIGFMIGLLAINFLSMELYFPALLCILLNRGFDALDGAVARHDGYTDFGIFLDAALDYIFYTGVIWGFALAYPYQNAVAAAFLLFAFSAVACCMLAYAIVAYKNDSARRNLLKLSPFYMTGPVQGAELFTAIVILCLIPSWFLPIAIILGCWFVVKALVVISTAYYNFVIAPKGKSK